MDSHDYNPSQSSKTSKFALKPRAFLFYLLSILVLFLAISFSFTRTNCIRIHHLRSVLTSNPNALQKILGFVNQFQKPTKTLIPNPISVPSRCVLWMAPFLSGGGYSSEAWSYMLALNEHTKVPSFRLKVEQHGDLESIEFWEGLPLHIKQLAFNLHETKCRMNETIVLCHSEPGAWYPPLFQTLPCPPTGYNGYMSVIGRTMFETDRVNVEHVRRCNQMDYIWVPTEFHVSTFIKSGVDASKVVKIGQPIDVEFFDPTNYTPLHLSSIGDLVLGARKKGSDLKREFIFLSVFKWEYRKGWDVLLKAYLKEFSGIDEVALYLLTNPYHSDSDFGNKILEFLGTSKIEKPGESWPAIYVIDTHIAQIDLPRMYKAANAFVLPSRGEGWGRPIVEAMSMSLPVIATNWSGPLEYLTEENSYPLPVDRLSEVMEGPFKGHLWAEPSVDKLQHLMRHVTANVEEAQAKARQAREDMITRFSPQVVAGVVTNQLKNILDTMV
ncbi:uncharacterized protein LOC8272376 [Ricinus communis]|uniref:Glycosyltransferase, putative n=1 Tax=Ricinus communis TaxID=3988 RepID=B9RSB3_RICCO|nr:uncharacterized protein LOC8272376 [Ricinus communis]EEF45756.1 glycosyltransferase, putative [Ricinus communis]|eukprot:XP_002516632.1 uncharacterized protein LOC8272376 [Ricinus communis]